MWLLAHLARDVYVDENAFLLGSTSATLDDEDARRAQNDANELMRAVDVAEDRSTTTRKRLEGLIERWTTPVSRVIARRREMDDITRTRWRERREGTGKSPWRWLPCSEAETSRRRR